MRAWEPRPPWSLALRVIPIVLALTAPPAVHGRTTAEGTDLPGSKRSSSRSSTTIPVHAGYDDGVQGSGTASRTIASPGAGEHPLRQRQQLHLPPSLEQGFRRGGRARRPRVMTWLNPTPRPRCGLSERPHPAAAADGGAGSCPSRSLTREVTANFCPSWIDLHAVQTLVRKTAVSAIGPAAVGRF